MVPTFFFRRGMSRSVTVSAGMAQTFFVRLFLHARAQKENANFRQRVKEQSDWQAEPVSLRQEAQERVRHLPRCYQCWLMAVVANAPDLSRTLTLPSAALLLRDVNKVQLLCSALSAVRLSSSYEAD